MTSEVETLSDWLIKLEQLNPSRIQLGLDRVREVMQRLPMPAPTVATINVGGTNGKGSCVLLLEHLARAKGLTTASYLSPHLVRFNERIRYNGREIEDHNLVIHFERVEAARQGVDLTYFEFTTLAALSYFADQKLDLLILEIGLGGRLDAVNAVEPDLSVLTSVDMDHQAWLGESLDSIGREKAGIFRHKKWALCASPMPQSVYAHIQEIQADAALADVDMSLTESRSGYIWRYHGLEIAVPPINAPKPSLLAALTAAHLLFGPLAEDVVAGLKNCRIPARMEQIIMHNRILYLDCAHNPAAARLLVTRLKQQGTASINIVIGMLADKDAKGFVQELAPIAESWLVVAPQSPRALPVEQLKNIIEIASNQPVKLAQNMEAISIENFPSDNPTLITGSFYTVGEFIKHHLRGVWGA